MFTLWYSVLGYKEYREKQSAPPKPKETPVACPLPPKKTEPSRIPVIEPAKAAPKPPSPIPPPPAPKVEIPTPKPPTSPLPQKSMEAPAKPPRSPSPHPIKPDAFEDIDYEEEDSEAEEDEEDSVIDSNARPVANSVNEFLNKEINTQQR